MTTRWLFFFQHCTASKWNCFWCFSILCLYLSDDHSRIVLERDDIDYINANLVLSPEANRKYILTQVRQTFPSFSGHLTSRVLCMKTEFTLKICAQYESLIKSIHRNVIRLATKWKIKVIIYCDCWKIRVLNCNF